MSDKYLIFGATGSIGSSLAHQLKACNQEAHLISRNEEELKSISEKLGFSFTVADVLEDGFVDKIKSDVSDSNRLFTSPISDDEATSTPCCAKFSIFSFNSKNSFGIFLPN